MVYNLLGDEQASIGEEEKAEIAEEETVGVTEEENLGIVEEESVGIAEEEQGNEDFEQLKDRNRDEKEVQVAPDNVETDEDTVKILLSSLGAGKSENELKRNLSLIGVASQKAMKLAGISDTYDKLRSIVNKTVMCQARPLLVEEFIGKRVEELFPPLIQMPARRVEEFFTKNTKYHYLLEVKWLGGSKAVITSRAKENKLISLNTLKVLSRKSGLELSKYIGFENIGFGEYGTLGEALKFLKGMDEVIKRKKNIWE